ncbi:hypothetical protein MC47_002265 [Citrobacter freundii]|nr:hypothetical protein MC47_002265 [Citrobacter freundii]
MAYTPLVYDFLIQAAIFPVPTHKYDNEYQEFQQFYFQHYNLCDRLICHIHHNKQPTAEPYSGHLYIVLLTPLYLESLALALSD